MKNFFEAFQRKHNTNLDGFVPIEETPEFKALESDFLTFCSYSSMPRSRKEIRKDLGELLSIPGITHVAFRYSEDGLELLLGTTHVYLTDRYTGLTHDIGEFIIRINRKLKRILFTNITRELIQKHNETTWAVYYHPHIPDHGVMCIEKHILNEYLTEGKIAALARTLIRALYTVDDHPYPEAEPRHWPVKG